MIKYKVELLLSFPFLAILFSWYLIIGLKSDSPTQNPERLFFTEKKLICYIIFLAIFVCGLLNVDIPVLQILLKNYYTNP